MLDYLTKNEKTIKIVISSLERTKTANKHFADLQDIVKALKLIDSANINGKLGIGTGSDPLKASTGVSIPTVWSQARAVLAGRQGVGTAVAMVAGPALTKLSQVQFNDVMNKALHDPKTAVALRDYLNSAPANANSSGSKLLQVWSATKTSGKYLASLGGKYWIGTPNYSENLARIAPTLAQSNEKKNALESENQNALNK